MKTVLASILGLMLAAVTAAQDTSSGIVVEDRSEYAAKWALVVGIDYANSKSGLKLDNAERDASAIARLLTEAYGFDCEILLGDQATRRAINLKLQEYERRVERTDCFLFYFAGHGVTDDGMPYLYPADVESEDGTISERLAPFEILRSRIGALHGLYVFDSCFSGEILNLRRIPPLDRAKDVQGDPVFEGRSVQILTSSADNQKAKDGTDGHSPFARSLMNGLRELHRREGTDVIGTRELAAFIREQLKGQRPQFLHLNPDPNTPASGDFLFVRQGVAPAEPVRAFVFQTLPGTYASLPGSPFEKTWFDEMPWLTPEMRLLLDGEYEKSPRQFLGSREVAAGVDPRRLTPSHVKELVRQMGRGAATIDDDAKKTTEALIALGSTIDRQESLARIIASLSELSRSSRESSSQMHLLALLKASTRETQQPEDVTALRELFVKATNSYHPEHQKGLRARVIADHANWHLQVKDYRAARELFEQALSGIDAIDPEKSSLFRVELLAGAAFACRHLAKNNDVSRQARLLWQAARERYEQAFAVVDREETGFPDAQLVRAYLHERSAWLAMDLWEVEEAERHFEQALSLREAAVPTPEIADTDAFLSICHASQGLAMAKRLRGECGRGELDRIRELLTNRLDQDTDEAKEAIVERLWNATERLGDCDFLRGRPRMSQALTVYSDRGLRDVQRLQDHVPVEKAEEQQLRFTCKAIIAAAITGDEGRLRHARNILRTGWETAKNRSAFLSLLHDVAQAFSEYRELKYDSTQPDLAQEKLDAIRRLVQVHAAPGLDRETAEFLMMLATVVSDEQRQRDAGILQAILPKGPDGNPPRGSVGYVREQYDRIIMLYGGSDGSQVGSGPKFIEFVNLVQGARQSASVNHERPFAIFHFPLSGANGLLLVQTGDSSDSGRVHLLEFGWKDVEDLSRERIERVNEKLKDLGENASVYWADDPLVNLPRNYPFGGFSRSP